LCSFPFILVKGSFFSLCCTTRLVNKVVCVCVCVCVTVTPNMTYVNFILLIELSLKILLSFSHLRSFEFTLSMACVSSYSVLTISCVQADRHKHTQADTQR